MTPERWQQINDLYHAALEHEGWQRAAFLEEACSEDEEVRREVASLLVAHEQAGSFMAAPAFDTAPKLLADNQPDPLLGRRIGPYQIIRQIGHGGMGAVYLAVRADNEYQKQVAIKIVKRGMDSNAILRRFRTERQILANLDHPNIAKLLDGGTTADGLPYFVMDYVEGLPLDLYCDAHKLSISARLKLFRTVCTAVDYAHRHGVIHRDLKPSNILVAEGVPKLLDFGIAKVLDPELSSGTLCSTATALRPMTPDYASPEQVRGEAITQASDVYSLGVLLYELLTGHHPYRLRSYTPQELERVICEEEPAKLSTIISRSEEIRLADGTSQITITPKSVSEARSDQPEKLRHRLAGDLDKIVLMALSKEPARRYSSVEQMSADIGQHLAGLPVIARRDTPWYRTAKFIKRNTVGVIAGVLALALLVVIGLNLLPRKALDPAIDSVAVLPFGNGSADSNTEYLSDGITESLINRLAQLPKLRVTASSTVSRYKGQQVDPQQVGRELKVRAVLMVRVLQQGDGLNIGTELVDAANGSRSWGGQYNRKLSEILVVQEEIAEQITERLRLRLTGAEREQLAKRETENPAAYREYLMGRHFLSQLTAEGLKRGLQHFERAVELDPRYALAHAGVADSYNAFVTRRVLSPREAYPRARAAALKAVELNPALSEAHSTLASVSLYQEWDWAAAEREFKRAIELKPDNARTHLRYAVALVWAGRFDEALRETERARELDPVNRGIHANMGLILYHARRYPEAIEELRRALTMDPNYFPTHTYLGVVYVEMGAYSEAITELKKAIELGGDPQVEAELGRAYALSGQTREARKILNELIDRSQRSYISPVEIAVVYTGLGERDQAFAWLEKAYEERERTLRTIKVSPRFDPLRSDPRFADLLRRVWFR